MRGSGVIAVSVVALVASSTVVGSSRASDGSGAAPTPVPPKAVPIAGRCVVAGGVALLLPHNRPLALGPVVTEPAQRASDGAGASYPADGSVASFSTLDVATGDCRKGNG